METPHVSGPPLYINTHSTADHGHREKKDNLDPISTALEWKWECEPCVCYTINTARVTVQHQYQSEVLTCNLHTHDMQLYICGHTQQSMHE